MQQGWPRSSDLGNQLAEQRIGPRKPRPCEVGRIVLVIAFMHKARAVRRRLQHRQRARNLPIGITRERVNDLRHRPDAVSTDMRAANAFSRTALEEPRILTAPHHAPRSSIELRVWRAF